MSYCLITETVLERIITWSHESNLESIQFSDLKYFCNSFGLNNEALTEAV